MVIKWDFNFAYNTPFRSLFLVDIFLLIIILVEIDFM